jgi:hypothetical protein
MEADVTVIYLFLLDFFPPRRIFHNASAIFLKLNRGGFFMRRISLLTCICVLAIALPAAAETATLTVTATVDSSYSVTLNTGNSTLSGSGTNAATLALGTVQRFGGASTTNGFSRATGVGNYTYSATGAFSIQVDKANSASPDYALTAQLGSAPATGTVWTLSSNTLSNSSAATLNATAGYGSPVSLDLSIQVSNSTTAAGAIGNTINFTATPN